MLRPKMPLGLLLALALGTTACGKVRQISSCRSLAREVNSAMDEIEALSKAKSVDETRIAQRYASLAKSLEPRAKGESPLAQALREYITVLQATDAAVRMHAALAKVQAGKVSDPRRELERLVKRERAATTRIDVECER